MSLVARQIETAGIPTVMIGVVEHALRALPAPRNVLVRFRLGQVFGDPGAQLQQRTILRATLGLLPRASVPGVIVELPYRWRRETYEAEAAR